MRPRGSKAFTRSSSINRPAWVVIRAAFPWRSTRSSIAVRLRAALGGIQIQVVSAADVPTAQTAATKENPEVIVIDALAPISDPDAVMDFLAALPQTTTSVLWGEEQPFGRDLKHQAVQRRLKLTTVERSEGVDPVLDLIRSRHR